MAGNEVLLENQKNYLAMKMNYKNLKEQKKEMLFSELHSLLTSGLDFSHSFRLLIEGEKENSVRLLLESLYASVVEGYTLWESFSRSKQFNALDCGVLRIGEETGQIAESLSFLAEYYRKRIEQRRMISGAVSYPLIILAIALVVLVFMVTVIVPMFEQVYARMGGELPWLNRQVIVFSSHMPACLLVLSGVIIVIVFCFYHWGKCDTVRAFLATVVLKIPGIGTAVRQNQQARFCKLLWLLYRSGIPLLHALELLKDIITFYPYRRSLEVICDGLRRGELFADGLACFPHIYDRKLCALLRVGEETNHLCEMFRRQSDTLTEELEHRLKQLGNFLEPVLILGVGSLVALVLIAMYLPMFRLGGVMGA